MSVMSFRTKEAKLAWNVRLTDRKKKKKDSERGKRSRTDEKESKREGNWEIKCQMSWKCQHSDAQETDTMRLFECLKCVHLKWDAPISFPVNETALERNYAHSWGNDRKLFFGKCAKLKARREACRPSTEAKMQHEVRGTGVGWCPESSGKLLYLHSDLTS